MEAHQFTAGADVKQRQSETEKPPLAVFVGAKSPEYWRPVVDAYAGAFDSQADDPDQGFYDLIEAYAFRTTSSDGAAQAAALVECMSAHPNPQIREQAREFVMAGLAADGDTAFRVARNLFEDDKTTIETMENIDIESIVINAEEIGLEALNKVLDALKTYWWERRQGFVEEFIHLAGRPPEI
ncbi:MAG TPA: hypothetical protein VFP35_04170 [Candidatus Saccharimonadales bacterium]|nr:hypothetical protein [Candidatus Saccharimonadales bacterium]